MEGKCCSCKETTTVYSFRKGVYNCSKCICDQIGKSFMDLFRKAITKIQPPVHVLVAVSGGSSSMFAYDILNSRIDVTRTSKTSFVKKIGSVSTKDLPIEGLLHIDQFTIKNVCECAKENGYNCVVLGDNATFISLHALGCLSQGRPDLFPIISQNDFVNYEPIAVLRPARQALPAETEFYCNYKGIAFDKTPSPLQKTFEVENVMLQNVAETGNEATPFAVQKMAEKLPLVEYTKKCPICGLPSNTDGPCQVCNAIHKTMTLM